MLKMQKLLSFLRLNDLSPVLADSKLIFQDDFSTLNLSSWQHEITMAGGGNWEFQAYMNNRSNSYVHDNTLFISPTLMSEFTDQGEDFLKHGTLALWGGAEADYCTNNDFYGCERSADGNNYLNPIISARVRSINSFSFKYGTVKFEAKLPKGDWLWPAVWLLPKYNQYGGWPSSGEIDILESRGNIQQYCGESRLDVSCMASTLHWGPRYEYNRYEMTTAEKCLTDGSDFNSDFHTFELTWNENGIQTKVDNDTVLTAYPDANGGWWKTGNFPKGMDNPWKYGSNMAPFDQEFYIIINLAVGGTNGYFPDGCDNLMGDKPWNNDDAYAPKQFWNGYKNWSQTWDFEGEESALQIRNLQVFSDDLEDSENGGCTFCVFRPNLVLSVLLLSWIFC